MAKNYVQPGRVLDYVNNGSVAITSGQVVVVGAVIGVALAAIPVGATGSVQVEGVFTLPKKTGTAVTQGAALVFKAASQEFTVGASAAGDVSGAAAFAFEAAEAGATSLAVKLTGVPGTVAA